MAHLAELQALWDGYVAAYRAGDAAGCAAIFAEDGEMHSPYGPPVTGRAAIAAAHSAWFEEGEENKTLTVLKAEVSGDLASCLLSYSADVPRAGGPPRRDAGVSLCSLRRQADGRYLIQILALVPEPS